MTSRDQDDRVRLWRVRVRLVALAAVVVVIASSALAPRAGAMTGGTPQTPPPGWAVKLFVNNGRGNCTGELIAPRWVITAGHCVLGWDFRRMSALVRGSMVGVVAAYHEPRYTSVRVAFPDLGLIKLAEDVVARYGASLLPIASAGDVSYFANRGVTAFGYGFDEAGLKANPHAMSSTLRKTPDGAWKLVPYCQVSGDACFLRSSWAKGSVIQHGDSGGAWVGWRYGGWRLLAVESGSLCDRIAGPGPVQCNFPAQYQAGTKPASDMGWIAGHVAGVSTAPAGPVPQVGGGPVPGAISPGPAGPTGSVSAANNNGQMVVQLATFPTGATHYFCHAGNPSDYPTGRTVTSQGVVTITSPNQGWASGLCSGGHNTKMWIGFQGTDGYDYYSNQVVIDVAARPGAGATAANNNGQMAVQVVNFPTGLTYFFCHAGNPADYPTGGTITSHSAVTITSPKQSWSSGLCSGGHNTNMWIGFQGADGHDYYSNQVVIDVPASPGASASVFGAGGQMSLQLAHFPTGATYYFCHQGAPSQYPTGGAIIGHARLDLSVPDGTYGPLCSGSGNAWIGIQGADGHDYYSNQITL